MELIWRQDCYQLPTGRTSFGFKDGIGQPAIEGGGVPGTNPLESPIKAGEFILGYPDETGALPAQPSPDILARNGTYIAFRKLHTRVAAYRQYLRANAASRQQEALLGAKMVGRWQSGAPLAVSPDGDDPELGPTRTETTDSCTRTTWGASSVRRVRTRDGQPSRRVGRRRERQCSSSPHDPTRYQLRAAPARRGIGGRRG